MFAICIQGLTLKSCWSRSGARFIEPKDSMTRSWALRNWVGWTSSCWRQSSQRRNWLSWKSWLRLSCCNYWHVCKVVAHIRIFWRFHQGQQQNHFIMIDFYWELLLNWMSIWTSWSYLSINLSKWLVFSNCLYDFL